MKPFLQPMRVVTLLGVAALSSQAETGSLPASGDGPSAAACTSTDHRHAHFKGHAARRANALKAPLKLTPVQEGAWATYVAAINKTAGRSAAT